jgi:polyprenyl-phospho-N-acetylgalactosaminyl synthase
MLVTRYHGVWTTVSAFNETPVIADVIADLRTVLDHVVCVDDAVTTTLRQGACTDRAR